MAQATIYAFNQISPGTIFTVDSEITIDSVINESNLNLNFEAGDTIQSGTELKVIDGIDSTDRPEVVINYTQV